MMNEDDRKAAYNKEIETKETELHLSKIQEDSIRLQLDKLDTKLEPLRIQDKDLRKEIP